MKTTLSPARIAANIAREIVRRNRVFKGKTKAEQRVLVAKDVIEQVRLGRIKANQGNYVSLGNIPWALYHGDGIADVRQCVLTPGVLCSCCGIGSLMVSTILFRDRVKTDVIGGYANLDHTASEDDADGGKTLRLFGRPQLDLIEIAFEVWTSDDAAMSSNEPKTYVNTPNLAKRAYAFGRRFRNARNRLIAIMRNIVKNGGTFKP